MDNIRAVVPQWNGDQTAVVWLRGTYTTDPNWSTEVVGISLAVRLPRRRRRNRRVRRAGVHWWRPESVDSAGRPPKRGLE